MDKEVIKIRNKKWNEENKELKAKLNHENYLQNKEKVNQRSREYARKIRDQVFEHYGNKCICCGETTREFLAIDHINNDGGKQRKVVGSGFSFQIWIVKNNYPDDLQILCHNCNLAKGFYGECPHERTRRRSNGI